jgi:hypothetical protein
MKIKIALVQMDIAPGEPLTNLSRMEEFVAKAKKKGADLVVFRKMPCADRCKAKPHSFNMHRLISNACKPWP